MLLDKIENLGNERHFFLQWKCDPRVTMFISARKRVIIQRRRPRDSFFARPFFSSRVEGRKPEFLHVSLFCTNDLYLAFAKDKGHFGALFLAAELVELRANLFSHDLEKCHPRLDLI